MSSENNIEKLVIIGSGPAGWTAAIYAARANLKPFLFAGRAKSVPVLELPGGQLMQTTEVENYPGFPEGVTGPKLMALFERQALRFNTRVATDSGETPNLDDEGHIYQYQDVSRVDFSVRPFRVWSDQDTEIRAHAVIVATGAAANWLGLENEKRLALSGGGVSACAVCDGALPVFRDQKLVVVGGGDSAMEESTYLSKFGSKIYVVHRRDEFRASKIMQKRVLENPKIEPVWDSEVADILGDDHVTGVRLRNVKTGEDRSLECRGFFAAIGHTPNSKFLNGQLELNAKKYIVLKDPFRSTTSVEGVFAAGDVADATYRQAVTAAGMGCKAAIDAERWLAERGID
ncbi:MAG: thioredoxin-disulfide reductase [Phycisphaerales bacterium]|nr:thioredoxin-disulfide reductase [Phycisphaerales bacterium]